MLPDTSIILCDDIEDQAINMYVCPSIMNAKCPIMIISVSFPSVLQFSGPLPAVLGGMPNLWSVRFAYNHFYGTYVYHVMLALTANHLISKS